MKGVELNYGEGNMSLSQVNTRLNQIESLMKKMVDSIVCTGKNCIGYKVKIGSESKYHKLDQEKTELRLLRDNLEIEEKIKN